MCSKDRPDLYAALGHDGPPVGMWQENLVTGEPLNICPLRALQLASPELREEVWRMQNQSFPLFKKGHLLVAGGIEDQPARWVDWMLCIEEVEGLTEHRYYELTRDDKDA